MGRYVKDNKSIVVPDYPVAPTDMRQEDWDQIFPGKKAFEEKFGKIIRYKLKGRTEHYEYYDKDSGEIKSITFQKAS